MNPYSKDYLFNFLQWSASDFVNNTDGFIRGRLFIIHPRGTCFDVTHLIKIVIIGCIWFCSAKWHDVHPGSTVNKKNRFSGGRMAARRNLAQGWMSDEWTHSHSVQ